MQEAVKNIIAELGEDPEREGLLKTPERVEKSLHYLTRGYQQNLEDVIHGAIFTSEQDDMIIVRDIEFYSLCEHHLLPFSAFFHETLQLVECLAPVRKLRHILRARFNQRIPKCGQLPRHGHVENPGMLKKGLFCIIRHGRSGEKRRISELSAA